MSSCKRVWVFLLFVIQIYAQANENNPFIWQVLVQYDIPVSNTSKTYLDESSIKVYSQEFQTIYQNKDLYGHNERLVVDMGDGCTNTSISDIQALNQNLTTSPSMMSQPSIALIRRGGRCLPWSEKIATVQSLSDTYRLQITGVIIYDNTAYPDTLLIEENTDNASYPIWPSSTIPKDRNITFMEDENSLDLSRTFIAVYYVPFAYIDRLNKTYLQRSAQDTDKLLLTQLAFSLSESHFSNDEPNDTGKPTFIIYSIVIVVVFILAVIMFRWCLVIKRRRGTNLLLDDQQITPHLISFMDLDLLCPIMNYEKVNLINSTCAICLEDFKEDFYIRVLPCRHGYCTACIDVWLTKKSSFCPICKSDCKHFLAQV